MRCHRPWAGLLLGLSFAFTTTARGAGPADALFSLVPPDARVTLAIEDLRGHAREFFASPLADALGRLPVVRAGLASDRFGQLERAGREVETVLGEKLSTIRDELLGDAVVLALRLAPDERPDRARLLLLVRVRDRALLDRLIEAVNAAQTRDGELVRVAERPRGRASYSVREFRPDTKPTEYYATLEDKTFAWSNSEELIQGVIDRKAGGPAGLGDDPKFQAVRRRLPGRAAASLFVDPRFLERLAAASPRTPPGEERVVAMLGRYGRAVQYAGAAIEWREGLIVRIEETIDPEKLDPWLRRWAARPGKVDPRTRRVPATALGMATAHVDFGAILEIVRDLVPESDRPRFDNLLLALKGVLLGRDPQDLLARLGPGVLAYVAPPAGEGPAPRLPAIAVVELAGDRGQPGAAAALDNALRTLLALYALDPKHGDGRLRVASRERPGGTVTTLSAAAPFAYAVGRDRLVLGTFAEVVARDLAAGDEPRADTRLTRLRAAFFPEAQSFACVDLPALYQFADRHRASLARWLAARGHRPDDDAARDLDQILALMDLFQGAFVASTIEPDATSAHRTAGLIARDPLNRPGP